MKTRNEKIKNLAEIVKDELFEASQDSIKYDYEKSRVFYCAYNTLEMMLAIIDWNNIKWEENKPSETNK